MSLAELRFPFPIPPGVELPPVLAEMLQGTGLEQVVLPHGGRAWLAVHHRDVADALGQPCLSRAAAGRTAGPRQFEQLPAYTTILDTDGQEHARLRRIVARALSRESVGRLRAQIGEIAVALVTDLDSALAPVDFLEAYALPLPLQVLSRVLGVPEADQPVFRKWVRALLYGRQLSTAEYERIAGELDDYVRELLARRQRVPEDDILGLLAARTSAGRLSITDAVALAAQILAAGFETTASLIASSVYLLLNHRRHWDALIEDPRLLDGTVEELLRYVPLNGGAGLPRVALEDVKVGGTQIRRGDTVFVSTIGANRDAEAFPEPHAFDPSRNAARPHLAFGHGIHKCLGAHLATAELAVSLEVLTSRVPTLDLAPEPPVTWRQDSLVRGPAMMMVTV